MKNYLYILFVFLNLISCKLENKKEVHQIEEKQIEEKQNLVKEKPIVDSFNKVAYENKKIIEVNYQEYLEKVNLDSIYEIVYLKDSPRYLKVDLNDDEKSDFAFLIRFKDALKSKNDFNLRMIIFHSNTDFPILGNGQYLDEDDFAVGWMDNWKIINEGKIFRSIFSREKDLIDSEEFLLKRKAIALFYDGSQIGLVYWNGEKYIYIHQYD